MNRIKRFFMTTLIGGLTVILPVAILIFAFNFVFDLVAKLIAPLSRLMIQHYDWPTVLADVVVLIIIICICFSVGIMIRTRLGAYVHRLVENNILGRIPGYSMIKETVGQFIGEKASPFSSVALARIYGNDTLVSAFITDRHENGMCTVFVPTGPNPTSGNIFHLKQEEVYPVDVSVEDAMRSIISCGAGSNKLITLYRQQQ